MLPQSTNKISTRHLRNFSSNTTLSHDEKLKRLDSDKSRRSNEYRDGIDDLIDETDEFDYDSPDRKKEPTFGFGDDSEA